MPATPLHLQCDLGEGCGVDCLHQIAVLVGCQNLKLFFELLSRTECADLRKCLWNDGGGGGAMARACDSSSQLLLRLFDHC